MRRRIKLAGNGPRGLAVIGAKAYVTEYFTDTIGVVDISPGIRHEARSLALGPKKPLSTARKGEMLFNDAGTGSGNDAKRKFDTPTLVEIWRTAPYLYDGRSLTMRDVLKKDNPKDMHGKTSALSKTKLSDLIEFLLSLQVLPS